MMGLNSNTFPPQWWHYFGTSEQVFTAAERAFADAPCRNAQRGTNERNLRFKGRDDATRIVKLNDDAYAIRYHDTDVVVFNRDGWVDVDASWDSRSTRIVIDWALPNAMYMRRDDLLFVRRRAVAWGACRCFAGSLEDCAPPDSVTSPEYGLVGVCGGVFRFRVDRNTCVVIDGLTPIMRDVVDKDIAAPIRARFKPLRQYLKTMASMELGSTAEGVMRGVSKRHRLSELVQCIVDDPEDDQWWGPLAGYFLKGAGTYAVDDRAALQRIYATAFDEAGAYVQKPIVFPSNVPAGYFCASVFDRR